MEFELTPVGDAVRLTLRGRLDTLAVQSGQDQVLASIVAPGRDTIVDLSGVDFVASQGVRMLIGATHGLRQRQARLVLFGAQPLVAESLRLAVGKLIPIADTEAQALARLQH